MNNICLQSIYSHLKHVLLIHFLLFTCACTIQGQSLIPYESRLNLNFKRLNKQALQDYQQPVRPGGTNGQPFWNTFSQSFIYAPVFDCPRFTEATQYLFTVNGEYQFKSKTSIHSLSPIWDKVPLGENELVVTAYDKHKHLLGEVYRRTFVKKASFHGPYLHAVRSYREAALKGLFYFIHQPYYLHWADSITPDLSYLHNAYPCKIIGATINIAVLQAKYDSTYRDLSTRIARNAAHFLIEQSQPADAPLAFFPPTYYGTQLTARKAENIGKAMMMEAVNVADALLSLYKLTLDSIYFQHAIGIANTYLRTQAADGSWPIKVDYQTGKAVNDIKAIPIQLIHLFDRLQTEFHFDQYVEARNRASAFIQNRILPSYNWYGQFEDMTVFLQPYENMTNCTAAPYATFLLSQPNTTLQEKEDALELIRFCEDQFVIWDTPANDKGIHPIGTPCVFEQYHYQTPVDNSACNLIRAFIAAHQHTGDVLYLAKAISLANTITIWQDASSGFLSTLWITRPGKSFWMNCTYDSVTTLLYLDNYLETLLSNKS
ncbi:MAG: hypothetical protein ACI36X_09040 [Bacteroidaceae bacterium]